MARLYHDYVPMAPCRELRLADLGVHTAAMGLPRPEVLLSSLPIEDARQVRRQLPLERVSALTEEGRRSAEGQVLEELRAIMRIPRG